MIQVVRAVVYDVQLCAAVFGAAGQNDANGTTKAANNRDWTYTWQVPVYLNGREIEYTVQETDVPKGYVACIALIAAGALGNVIDCIAYGLIFDNPMPPQVAQLFPPDGGYASLFNGRVVDMLYFPLCEWNWPQWMPMIGGQHFVFFQPIFNVADAALSVSVIVLILFYARYLATFSLKDDEPAAGQDQSTEDTPADGSVNDLTES